ASLKLTGKETYSITGIRPALVDVGGNHQAMVHAVADDGSEKRFPVDVRVDTPQEAEYYRYGGILPYVLRQVASNR
ncbi:MAG: hypothetical protein KGM92_03945, partial [Acidobacteriota bacterium]|nr:hypothetical protein [Acidobacteriota bacterium]